MQIGDRYYFDFNATAPLCDPVAKRLSRSDLPFANLSSVHTSGKMVRKEVDEARDNIYEIFSLDQKKHPLFFHSGATEGINTVIKGTAEALNNRGDGKLNFFCFSTDHPAVYRTGKYLESKGYSLVLIDVNKNGDFDDERVLEQMKACQGPVLLNYTWVNNESGVVFDLERAIKIKEKSGCLVHVDAVQAAGKIDGWWNLREELDAYTFSGHKFGALKGSGFTFISRKMPFVPSLRGGGQQDGMRSGTENTAGIITTAMAIKDLRDNYSFEQQNGAKEAIERVLLEGMGGKGEIVGKEGPRNGNTIYLIIPSVAGQTAAIAFDLAGIDISTGSACCSAAQIPSRILTSMGYNEQEAVSAIRISFSPYLKQEEAPLFADKIGTVIYKLLQ